MSRASVLAPLRERHFRFFFLARAVNLAGSSMALIALTFAVLEVSDSPSALGVVLAARSIPMLAFLLLGGVIADRFGRTLVIQACNVLAGLTQLAIAVLVISGQARIWQIVALSIVNGVVAAISMPALTGVVPALVSRSQLQPANVLLGLVRSGTIVIGPTLAAVLVVGVGAGWALAVDGVTYLASAALLLGCSIPAAGADRGGASMARQLREGWSFFTGTSWLWIVVLGFGVLNGLEAGAFLTLGPVLAKASAIGEHGWGLISSAQAVGLLVMGLLLTRFRLRRPLLWGMVGMIFYGVPMLVLGLSAQTAPVALAAFAGGLGIAVFELGWNLAMQENIDDAMLSRAYSYDALGSFIGIPVGQLAFGPLAAAYGLQPVILLAGIAYLGVVGLVLLSRSVRTLPRAETDPVSAGD